MKIKSNKIVIFDKLIVVVKMIVSICVVALIILRHSGFLEQAMNYILPLLGVNFIILFIQEWKSNRINAIISISTAIIILINVFYTLLVK